MCNEINSSQKIRIEACIQEVFPNQQECYELWVSDCQMRSFHYGYVLGNDKDIPKACKSISDGMLADFYNRFGTKSQSVIFYWRQRPIFLLDTLDDGREAVKMYLRFGIAGWTATDTEESKAQLKSILK